MGVDLSYREALERLFARTTGASRLGLERTTALLSEAGDPHLRLRALHIAGTNGKGSVAAMLDTVLRARGIRVGKYTSPHLVDFRERISVNGAPVEPDHISGFLDRWMPAVERTGATFFEATTAMAFSILAAEEVDVAVVETGLGGRLDATNVLRPEVAGVTNVGLDHTDLLGDTLESVAAEKAGIFKPGVPAVIGEPDVRIATLLEDQARDRGSSPVRLVRKDARLYGILVTSAGTEFTLEIAGRRLPVNLNLIGAHQAHNAATAILMLDSLPADLRVMPAEACASIGAAHVPGRFQVLGRFILDVAHNREGAAVLASTLRACSPPMPIVVLLCVLGDKDWRGIMREIAPLAAGFVLTQAPSAPASRAWNPDEAREYALSQGWHAVVEMDFLRALELAGEGAATVLVTGSFHTVGDAMLRLQPSPVAG